MLGRFFARTTPALKKLAVNPKPPTVQLPQTFPKLSKPFHTQSRPLMRSMFNPSPDAFLTSTSTKPHILVFLNSIEEAEGECVNFYSLLQNKLNYPVYLISPESSAEQEALAAKIECKFTHFSDSTFELADSFGAIRWRGVTRQIKPCLLVVSEQGKVTHTFDAGNLAAKNGSDAYLELLKQTPTPLCHKKL